jgi:putative membrane fusion protein
VLFKGVYIRNERQVVSDLFAVFANNPQSGVVAFTNKCGAKLAINSVFAVVYPDDGEIYNLRRIDEIQEQIDTLSQARLFLGIADDSQTGEVRTNAQNAQIEAFAGQLSDTHLRILRSISSGDFERVSSYKNEYLGLQGKINAVRGSTAATGLNERIRALESQLLLFEAALAGPLQELTVQEAGYFVGNADGYESLLVFDDTHSLTREEIENVIANPSLNVSDNVVGRVIDDYKWRMAALVETSRTKSISAGDTVNLRIGTYSRTVQATVIRSSHLDDGLTLFVFECELLNEEFVQKRVASVRLLLDDYTGIRVPKAAITFRANADGENYDVGVYVLHGSVIEFRRINILRSEEDFHVVENTNRQGWLRLFDELVVSGSNLYDGKIV